MTLAITYAELQAHYVIQDLDSESQSGLGGQKLKLQNACKTAHITFPHLQTLKKKIRMQCFYKIWQMQFRLRKNYWDRSLPISYVHTVKSRGPNIWVLIRPSVNPKISQNPVVYAVCNWDWYKMHESWILTLLFRIEGLSIGIAWQEIAERRTKRLRPKKELRRHERLQTCPLNWIEMLCN